MGYLLVFRGQQEELAGLERKESELRADFEKVERRAKYIYMTLKKQQATYLLVSHLGMSGAWFDVANISDIPDVKYQKHAHVILTMDNGRLLVYSDIRRFGELRLLREEADYPPLLQMAPEPFADEAYAYFLAQATAKKYKNKAIKAVIMTLG